VRRRSGVLASHQRWSDVPDDRGRRMHLTSRTSKKKRKLTMDRIKPLFTATATAKGGRNGHTESSDGIVKADLSVPKAMGGPGKPGTATPEHLFAAGYAACFGGALDFVGKQHRKDASKATITCAVTIGPRDTVG